MKVEAVGIITKPDDEGVARCGTALTVWFGERGIPAQLNHIDPAMDMLVILGGDGTLLRVAEKAAFHNIPVVGINLGNLGFLTEVAADEMYQALQAILEGKVRIEQRMMLRARCITTTGGKECDTFALNEVAVVKSSTRPVVRLRCWADQEYITTYKADGLLVSTPTGSTAYNLSAGGPIIQAELDAILVTPICPFMLETRPVLLSPLTRITCQLADPAEGVRVLVDGRATWEIGAKDCLVVEAAAKPLLLISSPHKGYFDILRNKLNWGGRDMGHPLSERAQEL
jgi:NAD+ kinase